MILSNKSVCFKLILAKYEVIFKKSSILIRLKFLAISLRIVLYYAGFT